MFVAQTLCKKRNVTDTLWIAVVPKLQKSAKQFIWTIMWNKETFIFEPTGEHMRANVLLLTSVTAHMMKIEVVVIYSKHILSQRKCVLYVHAYRRRKVYVEIEVHTMCQKFLFIY